MDWKIKAAIQNLIALLPDAISYEAYYWVQRRFGALRRGQGFRLPMGNDSFLDLSFRIAGPGEGPVEPGPAGLRIDPAAYPETWLGVLFPEARGAGRLPWY